MRLACRKSSHWPRPDEVPPAWRPASAGVKRKSGISHVAEDLPSSREPAPPYGVWSRAVTLLPDKCGIYIFLFPDRAYSRQNRKAEDMATCFDMGNNFSPHPWG
jgi:hypothetical protein